MFGVASLLLGGEWWKEGRLMYIDDERDGTKMVRAQLPRRVSHEKAEKCS